MTAVVSTQSAYGVCNEGSNSVADASITCEIRDATVQVQSKLHCEHLVFEPQTIAKAPLSQERQINLLMATAEHSPGQLHVAVGGDLRRGRHARFG
jgi:hypothetical protein